MSSIDLISVSNVTLMTCSSACAPNVPPLFVPLLSVFASRKSNPGTPVNFIKSNSDKTKVLLTDTSSPCVNINVSLPIDDSSQVFSLPGARIITRTASISHNIQAHQQLLWLISYHNDIKILLITFETTTSLCSTTLNFCTSTHPFALFFLPSHCPFPSTEYNVSFQMLCS